MRGFFAIATALFLASPASARIHLLLDERLRQSPLEQVIYRFVPRTSAAEVELFYVRNFMEGDTAAKYAATMRERDRAIYIGAERYPRDAQVTALTKTRGWFDLLGKIYFLVQNDAPDYAPLPKGLFTHDDLWRKYAELSGVAFAGIHNLHYLDNRPVALKKWRPGRGVCVHQGGTVIVPQNYVRFTPGGFQLYYQKKGSEAFLGDWVCTNTPYADTIFQVRVAQTDVLLQAQPVRYSAWNDAQPLALRIQADRPVSAPLALEIVSLAQQGETEFFFQGDRLLCKDRQCGKRGARFLLPQMHNLVQDLTFAIRGEGNNYFRGELRLVSGSVEVARAPVRVLPHSWLGEFYYAISHPSEYRLYFFSALGILLLFTWGLFLAVRFARRLFSRVAVQRDAARVAQSSAVLELRNGDLHLLTATQNPFGFELLGFGGIVRLSMHENTIAVQHGSGQGGTWPVGKFCYALPDGYVLDFRPVAGAVKVYLYNVSGTGLSATFARPAQTPLPVDSGVAAHAGN